MILIPNKARDTKIVPKTDAAITIQGAERNPRPINGAP
jgi:hypothetical protein